ncbi:MAG: thiamine pyrophosphokinase [Sphingobacteriaceae bacterium]|nr:MAG: thiamine pyrophosphokinase [Sphingobacteriaceae bacterium]
MSSHHIIREKQEPALLVLGLDNFDDELLGQLLEWSPTLMVTEIVAEKLNAYGIKVDWIITDKDDADIQSDVKVLHMNTESETTAALKFFTENNYPAVNVVTDELNMNEYLPFIHKINLVIFYNNQKIYPVTSGYSKWKPAREDIELLITPSNLQFTGLERLSENQFKTQEDGFFTLQFSNPFVMVAEGL